MEDYSELIARCKKYEKESLIKGVAMGAVILSRMGPIYEKGAITKFQNIAVKFSTELEDINTITDFDNFHESFMKYFQNEIKDQDGGWLSYGEAQKAINVFLKNYVGKHNHPDLITANRISPFLHVPLDSVMIKYFRKNHKTDYNQYIAPTHIKVNLEFKASRPTSTGKIPDSELSKLKYIFEEVYMAWQRWFRDIYPEKPILLDTIWALEREKD
jgi:hypothetical protein